MSWLKLCLALILIMGGAFAYNISSASYYVEKVHMGTVGGVGNSTDYTSRFTTTYQQPSTMTGLSGSFSVNIGWFNSTITYTFGLDLNMTYPINGSVFGPTQCSFLGTANSSFSGGSSNRRVTCSLYRDGIFQNNQSVSVSGDGLTNITFTGLLVPGNYSMTCFASDNTGVSDNATAWANLWAMTGCNVPNLGVTTTNTTITTTYFYQPLVIPYFDIKNIMFLLLIGCAIIGIVHYAGKM